MHFYVTPIPYAWEKIGPKQECCAMDFLHAKDDVWDFSQVPGPKPNLHAEFHENRLINNGKDDGRKMRFFPYTLHMGRRLWGSISHPHELWLEI